MPTIRNHHGHTVEISFGAIDLLPKSLKRMRVTRPLLCTDRGLVELGLVDQVQKRLSVAVTYDQTPPNPTEGAVEAATALYKSEGCDGIVAFGGGSPIDLAKAVAIMANPPGTLGDYMVGSANPKRIGECSPILAMPTTAGTGSEVSMGAIIVGHSGVKAALVSPSIVPKQVLADPELTLGLPPLLTAATGMDTMTHCIEAYLSPLDDPVADAIALEGLRRVTRSLSRAVENGSDRDARLDLMVAATMGGMAFAKGLGAVHAMSHAIGADQQLRLHHGTLNAVLLPHVLQYNADHVGDKMKGLIKAAGLPKETQLWDWISLNNQRIGLPKTLAEMGVTAEMIPDLVAHSLPDMTSLTNPRPMTEDGYDALFRQALAA